jgi:peptide/nickel transport system substrate-binding protein
MSVRKVIMGLTVGALMFFIAAPSTPVSGASAKKLLIGVGQEPTSMDPSLIYSGADYIIVDNWAEHLIDIEPNGDLVPRLASSYKVSPDGKTIEYTLRKGVKFHSGDPLTSKDVQFSFERGLARNSTIKTRLRSFERFEIIDDYRFNVHLKAPDVVLIPARGGPAIVSKSYYDRVGEEKFVKNPAGTGPYKFVNYAHGEYVDIERFEDYWGHKPSVKEARFYFIPEDTTRIAKLKTGEIDFTNMVPYPSVKEVQNSAGLKIIKCSMDHPTMSVVFATRNPKTPWHDKRVRKAMAHAIDWNAIKKNVLFDVPDHWAYLAPHELGYDPNLKPYDYDPKKAKQLLAEAGYPNGFPFKLHWEITSFHPMPREVSEAIASYLEAVGIKTRLIGEEYTAALARFRASKGPEAEYAIYRISGRSGGADPSYYLDLFYGCQGGFSLYCNEELDKLTAQAKATVNNAERAEVIKKAVRMVNEEVAAIPIFTAVVVYGMKKNIDFKPTPKRPSEIVLVKDITVN